MHFPRKRDRTPRPRTAFATLVTLAGVFAGAGAGACSKTAAPDTTATENASAREAATRPGVTGALPAPPSDSAQAVTTAPPAASCLLVPAAQLRRVEPRHYLVERSALTGALTDINNRPERWFREDALEWSEASRTLHVFGVESGDACGIHNGDRILNVQGIAVDDPLLGQKLQTELQTASELLVVVDRDNTIHKIRYDLVERLPN